MLKVGEKLKRKRQNATIVCARHGRGMSENEGERVTVAN